MCYKLCPKGGEPWLDGIPGGLRAVNGLQVVQEPVVLCRACGVVNVGGQEDVVRHANIHLQVCAAGIGTAVLPGHAPMHSNRLSHTEM